MTIIIDEAVPVSPAKTCIAFLDALGRRDLDAATALTAEGFTMTFPGPARFTEFQELLDWGASRYRRIAKTTERVEEVPLGLRVAVYVSGTLSGEWPDGTPSTGIRFIDRFEVEQGLICTQEVWNDLAETGRGL